MDGQPLHSDGVMRMDSCAKYDSLHKSSRLGYLCYVLMLIWKWSWDPVAECEQTRYWKMWVFLIWCGLCQIWGSKYHLGLKSPFIINYHAASFFSHILHSCAAPLCSQFNTSAVTICSHFFIHPTVPFCSRILYWCATPLLFAVTVSSFLSFVLLIQPWTFSSLQSFTQGTYFFSSVLTSPHVLLSIS